MTDERPINEVIAENIKRYWDTDKMGITEFGSKLGASSTEIKRIIAGGNITVTKLQQIAEILGVKTIDLVEDWKE